MTNPYSNTDNSAANPMTDPLGFIRKLWASMHVPGMVAPPMSVDELDKKIQDLKTVESWLTVNMNMLRGTIQTLEVQRATLSALQSIGESFAQHAQHAQQAATGHSDDTAGEARPVWGWPMPSAKAADEANKEEPAKEAAAEAAAQTAAESPQAASNDKPAESGAANTAGTPFANPAVWWNLLQDQFKQAVSKAVQPEPASATGTTGATAAASAGAPAAEKKPATKSAARTPKKSSPKKPSKPASQPAATAKTESRATLPARKPAAAKAATRTRTAAKGTKGGKASAV